MNKMFIVACLLAIGCKANVSDPKSAANAPEKETPGAGKPNNNDDKEPGAGKPTFSQCASSAGSFVWDESKKAYNYVTSPEAKKFYSETWDKTKATANQAYDDAVKAYHEYQENSDKEEKTNSKDPE